MAETNAQTAGGRSPWVYTTIILSAVVLGLYIQNTMLITGIAGDRVVIANTDDRQPSPSPSGNNNQDNTQPAQQPSATKVELGDAPVKGNANAPLTIVEFSDFECPFCGRFYTATLPSIDKDYIQTGKAKLAYKHFPLSFHPSAEPAAIASECAKEQGKFWEFHGKIFDNQQLLSKNPYSGWAKELGLDVTKFDSCVSSAKYKQDVQSDFSEGSNLGVSGTPTFYICKGTENCREIVGAQPYSAFKQVIDALLV